MAYPYRCPHSPQLPLPPAFVPARNLCFLLLGRISRFFIATCWLGASRRSAEQRAAGNEGGVRGKPTRLRRAGHNVVMTDAAIKDNYDSGNRFYFRVYLFCSYRLSSSSSSLPLPSPSPPHMPLPCYLPPFRSLPKLTPCLRLLLWLAWAMARPPGCQRSSAGWRRLQFNVYFSGDQRGIEIMRIIRVSLQRLAKKLYPRGLCENIRKIL